MHVTPALEVSDVSFSYGQGKVLDHISFSVNRGDYVGLVGPNGAGKSTLLKVILGLLTPDEGRVSILGTDLAGFTDWHRIGYVPQKATNFDAGFPASVLDVALMGRYGMRGLLRDITAADRDAVRAALEQVGMWEFRDRLIGDLSGGQQQRVFIARALAASPEILFLDEPTVGVEQQKVDEFYALLKQLNRDLGLTLVLVTHDVETIVEQASHIACIDTSLVCYDTAQDFARDKHLGATLGDIRIVTRHS